MTPRTPMDRLCQTPALVTGSHGTQTRCREASACSLLGPSWETNHSSTTNMPGIDRNSLHRQIIAAVRVSDCEVENKGWSEGEIGVSFGLL